MISEISATHTGELVIGEISIPCHVLEDSTRAVSGRGMQNSLGFAKNASGMALNNFVDSKLATYLSEETLNKLKNPLTFKRVGSGGSAPATFAYDATILIDLCDAVIQANRAGELSKHQQRHAIAAEILVRSVAKIGIIALVDEATGYQDTRERLALQKILDRYLKEERRKWSKTFPDEFWFKLVKIKGHESYLALQRPGFVGHWVNDVVYSRLAPGIKNKLKELNPRLPSGSRKSKHHQHFTEDFGLPELKDHLNKVMVLMDAASNKKEFERLLNRSLPKYGDTLELDLDNPNDD
ncbi:P63C domain-containing protein [Ahrensia kielensis]|uniref:P63C domain-containing protein n=1 Tax=Ahrensia kielensis TaxID=76980 RepID=A0ABU9T4S4_9HYPH